MLGPCLLYIVPCWAHVGPCWAHVGRPCWAPMLGAHVGPILALWWGMLGHVGPRLGHVGHVGPMLGHVETKLAT